MVNDKWSLPFRLTSNFIQMLFGLTNSDSFPRKSRVYPTMQIHLMLQLYRFLGNVIYLFRSTSMQSGILKYIILVFVFVVLCLY